MNIKMIPELLDKYYQGQTTPEEENVLKQYLSGDNVSSEFQADKELFSLLENERKDVLSEEELGGIIDRSIHDSIRSERQGERKLYLKSLSIAASIILLVTLYFTFRPSLFNGNKYRYKDTYEDPQLAYNQAKNTLLFISKTMGKGNKGVKELGEFNEALSHLEALSGFNEGMRKVHTIKELNKINMDSSNE